MSRPPIGGTVNLRKIENGRPERRVIALGALGVALPEVRAKSTGAGVRFEGHAAVFNTLSAELWGFYERIAETAFDDALDGKNDVRFLINHDPSLVLARSKLGEGTLELSKDDAGLLAAADLPETQPSRDIAESLRRGDVDQMSFGFRTLEDSWEEETVPVVIDGQESMTTIVVRTLVRVELFDVSVVTFPAYPDTDAGLRYLGLTPDGALLGQLRSGPDPDTLKHVLAGLEEIGQRKGKVLSKKNRDSLTAAIDTLQTVLDDAAGDDEETGRSHDDENELRRLRLRALELDVPVFTLTPR